MIRFQPLKKIALAFLAHLDGAITVSPISQ